MRSLLESFVLVASVTVFARLVEAHLGIANLALFYLLPVMVQSGRRGLRAGLLTSLLAALAFNFFLVPPRLTLHVANPDNLVTMLVLFAVALAVSELSARLRAQAARAERLEGDRQRGQLRETLLSSLSHDLRTPITAIRAGLDTLAQVDGEGRDAILASVRGEATRLERLVSNLLELNRIEAGAIGRPDLIDLTDTIAAVIDTLPAAARASVKVALESDLPLVRADPNMLHHMLLNLVENALTHGQGREVVIAAKPADGGLLLSVSDRGPGIPVGAEDSIFSRFVSRGPSDREPAGTGLGLAIVRGFGNTLGMPTSAANRTDGPGAIFSIAIPASLLVATEAGA